MRAIPLAITCISAIVLGAALCLAFEDVGGDFGSAWLEKYGTREPSTFDNPNSLWDWGNAPKGLPLKTAPFTRRERPPNGIIPLLSPTTAL